MIHCHWTNIGEWMLLDSMNVEDDILAARSTAVVDVIPAKENKYIGTVLFTVFQTSRPTLFDQHDINFFAKITHIAVCIIKRGK